ncbi:MAG: 4Fe-4S binding protein [Casimicrobiaceae bacterium]
MSIAVAAPFAPRGGRTWLARYGEWLKRNATMVRGVQWVVVLAYAFLIIVPALMPLPGNEARALNNLTVFAQWAFWGLWWPFVILSMFIVGRTWCGVFCPEGTLTEAASKFGLHRAVPRWMKWGGWPFVAFAMTTIFGQLVSVYQYPQAAMLVLGGSTLAAIGVGFVYGKEKRVWCRHLCPVNGVFAALTRMAPMYYRVDRDAWTKNAGHIAIHPVNCAPLVRIRRMNGTSECHMCGRCSGHLDAVEMAWRPPNAEVAALPLSQASAWDAALIVFGMIGLALGAFHWNASPWFIDLKLAAAGLVIDHGPQWLLQDNAPWWLLTHYPQANDTFTWLDGSLIAGYIVATAAVVSGGVWAALEMAALPYAALRRPHALRLSYALIPLAGLGVFLGLSSLTVSLARAEGLATDGVVPLLRASVLAIGAAWSLRLAWLQLADLPRITQRLASVIAFAVAVAIVVGAWSLLFFHWAR